MTPSTTPVPSGHATPPPAADIHLEVADNHTQVGLPISVRLEPVSDRMYSHALFQGPNGKYYRFTLCRKSDGQRLALRPEDWQERLQRMQALCDQIFGPREMPSSMAVNFSTGDVHVREKETCQYTKTSDYAQAVLQHRDSFTKIGKIGSTDVRFQVNCPYDPYGFYSRGRPLSSVKNTSSEKGYLTKKLARPYPAVFRPSFSPKQASQTKSPLLRPAPLRPAHPHLGVERDDATYWRENFLHRIRNPTMMTVQDAGVLSHYYRAKHASALAANQVSRYQFHIKMTSYSDFKQDPRDRRKHVNDNFAQYITHSLPKGARAGDEFVIYPTGNHFVIFHFDYENQKLQYYDPKGQVDRPVLIQKEQRDVQVLEQIDQTTLRQMYIEAFGHDPSDANSIKKVLPGAERSPQRHDGHNCLMFCYDFADRTITGQNYDTIYGAHQNIANRGKDYALAHWADLRNQIADQMQDTILNIDDGDLIFD